MEACSTGIGTKRQNSSPVIQGEIPSILTYISCPILLSTKMKKVETKYTCLVLFFTETT